MRARVLLLGLLVMTGIARAENAAGGAGVPHMSDLLKVTLKDHKLVFERVDTGDPVLEDGSTTMTDIQNVEGQAIINRLPQGVMYISFNGRGGTVQVQKDRGLIIGKLPDGTQVQYNDMNGKQVSLYVGAEGKQGVSVTTASFAELCAKQPENVAKYLVPLFEMYDLGTISVRPQEEERVFGGLMAVDPAVQKVVEGILPRLDDDSAEVRTGAAVELSGLGVKAVPVLRAMDLKKLPVQTRIAIRGFLEPFSGSAEAQLKDRDFLVLCLASENAEIAKMAKAQLEKVTGQPVEFDLSGDVLKRRMASLKLLMK